MKPLVPHMKNRKFPSLGGTAALAEASPEELRILLCLFEMGRVSDDSVAALARAAGCGTARARSALRYWEEVGVLIPEEEAAPQGEPAAPLPRPHEEDEENGGEETAAVIRDRKLAAFIDSCQATVGRVFNTRELNILTGMLDRLPFSEEYILTLIAYCKKKAKRFSFIYLEKTAYSMLDRECLTLDDLNAYLAALERFTSEEWKLRRLLGIGERRLGSREQEFLMRWTGDFGYGEEIIGIAYDITVNQTGKISMPYMDKLLTRFHEAGCTDTEAVNALLEKERAEHAAGAVSRHTGSSKGKKSGGGVYATGTAPDDPSATRGSSFRGHDYLSAALRRSYGDSGLTDEEPTDDKK